MKLHELAPAEGSRKVRNRVGRGLGSGNGKTSGRGMKGQRLAVAVVSVQALKAVRCLCIAESRSVGSRTFGQRPLPRSTWRH